MSLARFIFYTYLLRNHPFNFVPSHSSPFIVSPLASTEAVSGSVGRTFFAGLQSSDARAPTIQRFHEMPCFVAYDAECHTGASYLSPSVIEISCTLMRQQWIGRHQ
jgi:hypothetical protein